jgi:hypothetical protein
MHKKEAPADIGTRAGFVRCLSLRAIISINWVLVMPVDDHFYIGLRNAMPISVGLWLGLFLTMRLLVPF